MKRQVAILFALSLAATAPLGAQVVPHGTLGSLPANSFGGSGIPTNTVMLGTGVGGVIMGLSATPRYTSPSLTNDGAGTFFAGTGISTGGPTNAGFAGWNFDYFVGNNPGYLFFLYVDTDPAVGNPLSSMTAYTTSGNVFDSSNLGYWPGFDPNVPGEYSFELVQVGAFGPVDYVAMNVEVGTSTAPEPASLALVATGLVGVCGVARRKKVQQPADSGA